MLPPGLPVGCFPFLRQCCTCFSFDRTHTDLSLRLRRRCRLMFANTWLARAASASVLTAVNGAPPGLRAGDTGGLRAVPCRRAVPERLQRAPVQAVQAGLPAVLRRPGARPLPPHAAVHFLLPCIPRLPPHRSAYLIFSSLDAQQTGETSRACRRAAGRCSSPVCLAPAWSVDGVVLHVCVHRLVRSR